MKTKILITCFIMLATTSLKAQLNKGTSLLGFNFGYTSNKVTNDITTTTNSGNTFNFSPSFAVAYKKNNFFGFDLGYRNSTNSQNNAEQKIRGYSADIFLRHYVTMGKRFYFFWQENLGYTYEKNTTKNGNLLVTETKSNTIALSFYPGISYAVSPHVQFEMGIQNLGLLSYNVSKSKNLQTAPLYTTTTSKGFSLNSTLSGITNFTIGARFVLGNK